MSNASNVSHYDETDPTFVADLIASDKVVIKVGLWLRSFDFTIQLPPLRIRPSIEQMNDYSDRGDIYVRRSETAEWNRVEVKRLGFHFTNALDFPYPMFIFEKAHNWERANPKPTHYIIVNATETYCGVMKVEKAREHWEEKEIWNRWKQGMRRVLYCPAKCLDFHELK